MLICCAQFSCWQGGFLLSCTHGRGVDALRQAGHDAAAHWEKHNTRKLDTLATIAAIKKFRNGEHTREAGNAETRPQRFGDPPTLPSSAWYRWSTRCRNLEAGEASLN